MTHFGLNLKLSIDMSLRDAVRRFYEAGFGCERREPRPELDQFFFADEASVGVFYVPVERALTAEQWAIAPWLEYLVDDVEATAARLVANGAVRVEYMDKTHQYLRGPGGPVFRLAKFETA